MNRSSQTEQQLPAWDSVITTRFVGGCVLAAGSLFVLLSLLSYDPHDPNGVLENFPTRAVPANWCGRLGALVSHHLLLFYGLAGVLLVPALMAWGISHLRGRGLGEIRWNLIGMAGGVLCGSSLAGLSQPVAVWSLERSLGIVAPGGLVGLWVNDQFRWLFGATGSYLFLTVALFAFVMLMTGTTAAQLVHATGVLADMLRSGLRASWKHRRFWRWKRLAAPNAAQHMEFVSVAAAGGLSEPAVTRSTRVFLLSDDDAAGDAASSDSMIGAESTDEPPDPREAEAGDADDTDAASASIEHVAEASSEMSEETEQLESSLETELLIETPPVDKEIPRDVIRRREKLAAQAPQLRKQDRLDEQMEAADTSVDPDFDLPPVYLLEEHDVQGSVSQDDLLERSETLVRCLNDFDIETELVNIHRGPTVTMFELALAPGIKVNKVVNLSDNIAMALSATNVRVLAPIPGRSTVGVEMPNIERDIVRMRPILTSEAFAASRCDLPIILGRNAKGEPLICDLRKMPHILMAGATGSGKSVCINSILLSLLMTRTPAQVKLILVDPKQVELMPYQGVPHLMAPVINDMKRAGGVLEWAVRKMENRYEVLSAVGVREINTYNRLTAEERLKRVRNPNFDTDLLQEHMPYIVIIVDEFADLMMVAAKEVETSITRLAQMARAVGIHVILATQRPSVDVITGLIKSNMPCRISFMVSSKVDSRTILDQNGAEKLVGQGDMLFLPPTSSTLIRGKGVFVDDQEIERVVEYVKKQRAPEYHDELVEAGRPPGEDGGAGLAGHTDELFEDAVEIVLTTQRGSVSLLQRKLAIGYTRAAKLIDMMADAGILGPYNGAKAREILMDLEAWDKVKDEILARATGQRTGRATSKASGSQRASSRLPSEPPGAAAAADVSEADIADPDFDFDLDSDLDSDPDHMHMAEAEQVDEVEIEESDEADVDAEQSPDESNGESIDGTQEAA